jgi:two-component SAPR family response regulator
VVEDALPLRGKRFVVAEDNFLVAAYLSDVLAEAHGHVVGIAADASSLMGMIQHERVDCVLLNIGLRESSAIEAAIALQDRGLPFILVTGYPQASLPLALKTAPYLAKPVSQSDLIRRILSVLNHAERN